jgi:hypothetical protein
MASGGFRYTQVVSGPEPGQLLLLDLQSKALFELQTGLETQVSAGRRCQHLQRHPRRMYARACRLSQSGNMLCSFATLVKDILKLQVDPYQRDFMNMLFLTPGWELALQRVG